MATDVAQAETTLPSPSYHISDDVPCARCVLKAEKLIEEGNLVLAEEQLKIFFKENEAANHFLARAYLCKAILSAPSSSTDLGKLEECTSFIVKVVNMCKKTPPYHFLVFNASVILWKLVRPFQVSGSRKHLVQTLSAVSKGLEDINEKDNLWRLEIMIALLNSQLECGQTEEASRTCGKALHLAKICGRQRIPEILRLQITNGLTEPKEYKDIIKADPQLRLLQKVFKLRITSTSAEGKDWEEKLTKLLNLIVKDERTSGAVSGRKTTEKMHHPKAVSPEMRSPCLVELAELALLHSQFDVASKCIQNFTSEKQSSSVMLRAELVECQLELAGLRDSTYTRSSVEVRVSVLNRYCEVLSSAHRLKLPGLVEQGAVLLWNAALPLLQHNLRQRLIKPLSQMTLYMELEESLLHQLRCEAHLELAKCLEENEKPAMALEHIEKALKLDTTGQYLSVLNDMKHRLMLSSQLYNVPERKLDQATSLLEQMKTASCSRGEKSRALLVKVGTLLDPKHFEKAVNRPLDEVASSDFTDHLLSLHSKCEGYKTLKTAPEKHQDDWGEEEDGEDRERCSLWALLAKVSRRQEVWNVSLVASKYCLLYNDGRWDLPGARNLKVASLAALSKTNTAAVSQSSLNEHGQSSTPGTKEGDPSIKIDDHTPKEDDSGPKEDDLAPKGGDSDSKKSSTTSLKQRSGKSLHDASVTSTAVKSVAGSVHREGKKQRKGGADREMLRLLSTAACLHGEAVVHLVQSEGLQLFVPPTPPPAARHVRDFNVATNDMWKAYCDWIKEMSNDAMTSFLQSAELAVQLRESWMLHNAVVYMWNYNLHLTSSHSAEPLVDHYKLLLNLAKQCTEYSEVSVVCGVSSVLVRGVLQRWTPILLEAQRNPPETPSGKKQDKGKGKTPASLLGMVDPSADEDFKGALKICEEALKDGRQLPLPHRQPLLVSWVELKQILQQSVDKTLGQGSESGSVAHENSVVVAMEMVKTRGGPFGDFTYYPTIKEMMEHMTGAGVEDSSVALDLWTGLCELAWKSKDRQQAETCADRAIAAGPGALEMVRKESTDKKTKYRSYLLTLAQCHQMLSLAHAIKGSCLSAKASSDVSLFKEAKQCLLTAARHGQEGGSYQHVIQACRVAWNMSLKRTSTAEGRVSLVPLLLELLDLLASLSSRKRKSVGPGGDDGGLVGTEEDMELRVSMYSIVLQTYWDKGDWLGGFGVCDEAMQVLPRTHHMELVRYRIVFKSKLGRAVEGDMVLFSEESEECLATMWFLVASNAVSKKDKMAAYRKAINSITLTVNGWRKVDYLMEFGKWLYATHHSKTTALAQFQDALQLVMCLRSPSPQEATADGDESGDQQQGDHSEEGSDPPPKPPNPLPRLLRDLSPQPLDSIANVPHLLRILHIFITMSLLEEEGRREHQEHIRTALDITVIVWKSFLKDFPPPKQTQAGGKDRQSTLSPSKEGCSSTPLPPTSQEWATFTLTDDMRTAVKEGSDESSINKHTITSPGLTLHYLQLLVKGLLSYDLHTSCFPILALQLVLAEELMENKTLTTLVRMRVIALCKELSLDVGVSHHKDSLPPSPFLPEDIARSEAELVRKKVHEEASAKELERWESIRTTKTASTTTGLPQTQYKDPTSSGGGGGGELFSSGDTIGDEPCLKRVWLEEANMLIEEGCYNTIHKMLQSVCASAKASGDSPTLCSALLCTAKLHWREKMWSRAAQVILEAQKVPCSLEDCLNSYLLMVEVLTSQQLPVQKVVQHGVDVFRRIADTQCNSGGFSEYAVDMLEFRMHLKALESSPLEVDHLLVLIRGMEERGRTGAALLMMEGCIDVIRTALKKLDRSSQDHHSLQLTFVDFAQHFIAKLQKRISFIEDNSPYVTMEGATLPSVCRLATVQLRLSEVLVNMFTEYVNHQQMKSLRVREQPSVERMIEEFVGDTTAICSEEEKWTILAKSAAEYALTLLSSSHGLLTDPFLLSEVHLLTGQCQLAVANSYNSDITMQWSTTLYEELATTGLVEDSGQVGTGEESDEPPQANKKNYSTLSLVMRGEDAKKDQTKEAVFVHYLTKATHSLGQAVTLGLEVQHLDVVQEASLMLTDCFGLLDPASSVQYLALYQSCSVASLLSSALCSMHSSPSCSQLAATLRMKELTVGRRHIPAYVKSCPILEQMEALCNLCVSGEHLTFCKNFPSNMRFVILHHSPTRDKLYCGYMLPPQPPPPASSKKTSTPAPAHVPLEPVVTCSDVSAETLDAILELMVEHRDELLSRISDKERQVARVKRLEELMCQPNIDTQTEDYNTPEHSEDTLTLSDALAAMEAYLSQALDLIDVAMKREKSSNLTFIILADSYLMQLPLEALSVFSRPCVEALSRDFSLAMLYQKLKRFSSDSADGDKQPSKTPAKKDKGDKFKPQPETLMASCTTTKYFLDMDQQLSHSSQKGSVQHVTMCLG
jgi:tetratricopeptide (TPR) repeat protein